MYIKKTKSGSYEAIVDVAPVGSNTRKQRSKTFTKKSEAKKWALNKLSERDNNQIIDDHGYTLGDFLLLWLERYAKVNLSPTTVNGYSVIVKRHVIPILGHIPLSNLNSRFIQQYEFQKLQNGKLNGDGGLSKKTVLQHHNVLSKSLNYAVKHGLIKNNPCKKVEAPKARRKPMRNLNPRQVRKLLKTAKNKSYWHYAFIYLAIHTGARRSELMGLNWKDISLKDKKLTFRRVYIKGIDTISTFKSLTKNHKIREITLSDENIAVLNKLKAKQEKLKENKDYEDQDIVFAKDNGKPYSPDVPSRRFKSVAKKAGLGEFRLHDLRHTFATISLEAGVPIKVISERLGHSSVTTTMDIYSHVCSEFQRKAQKIFNQYLENN
ncbi:MAG: site-specific integrase [Halanaerobium sp. MSAO_Bac5]|nr:MAG: site-specific integrase [Halanaerobium sp. MSAO_Bac5]